VGHDDVGGVKTKRWRCKGQDDFGGAKAKQHQANDTGRAILASRAKYQIWTLEPHGVGILNTSTGRIKHPPGITDTNTGKTPSLAPYRALPNRALDLYRCIYHSIILRSFVIPHDVPGFVVMYPEIICNRMRNDFQSNDFEQCIYRVNS
jgi:hypothetical protein